MMIYRTRGQRGGNTATSVTASKSTLLHTLLLKGRRPRRTFERRTRETGTGTSTMTSGAIYPPDRRPPFTSWDDIARLFTDHLEVQRFNQLLTALTVPRRGMHAGSVHHGTCRCRQLGTWTPFTCAIRTSGSTAISSGCFASMHQSPPSPPSWYVFLLLGCHTADCHPNTASR
jgi:hypothetical protein